MIDDESRERDTDPAPPDYDEELPPTKRGKDIGRISPLPPIGDLIGAPGWVLVLLHEVRSLRKDIAVLLSKFMK